MKKALLFGSLVAGALSLFAEQTLAEKTMLTGAKAIAKFPARLQDSEFAHLADASWCQLMQGVEYFYGRFDKIRKNTVDFTYTKNDVSIIKIDYKNAPVRMKFVDNRRNGGSNKQTSYVANKYNALFGINCTFPAWYSKMEGTVVNNGNKEGGLALNDDKTFEFFKSSWWQTHPNAEGYTDAFSTEAMGLYQGTQTLVGDYNKDGGAPYTFMGEAADQVLYICVVDGRTSRSQGMEYGCVHTFLVALGCFNGMCLDGGGSTTMVCQKSLMPPFPEYKMNELQHASDNANANPNYYTMNHTSDNPERAVCNQLLFVEDVASVTPDIGRHGSCMLGSTVLGTTLAKFNKNSTQTLSVTADSGYVIASLSVGGTMVGEAKGRASYSDSILLKGDKAIAVSFVKKGAWWLKPTVKNDFLLEAKSGNNGTDLTTQHPDVCLDEQEQDVFFSTSVHGYSSGSYWTGLREFSVTSLKSWNTGDAIKPVMGTDKNINGTGTYAYSIAASRAAGAVVAMQKVNSGTKYPVVCPIGGQWGGGTAFDSTRDDRYVMTVLSFPDDKNAYHTTSPGVFGTDGKRFFGGYNRNAHIVEFDVKTGTDGHLEFHHTGKVIKHKAQVTGLVCKKVVLGGVPKDVLFTSHHSSTLDSLDIVIPGEMAVQTNSSGLPTCLTIPYHLDNIAVTGIADGTPRIIGHVLDTANAQHGNYVVYDLKDDLSGLRFPDPIAIVNAQSAFGKATGCIASLDDDTTAFINYYNAKELHALTVQGDASVEPPAELIPVAKPTAKTGLVYTGKSQTGVAAATGYTVSNGSGTGVGSYTATVTLAEGYCWADESTAALSLPWSIGRAALKVTAENKTVTYGASAPAFTVTYSGFVNGETASALGGTLAFDCAYTATTAAGSKLDIMPKGLTASNYAITFVGGTLTVVKLTVVLNPASAVYDGTAKDPAVTVLDGSGTAVAAGSYTVRKPTGEVKDAGMYAYGVTMGTGDLAGLELTADFEIAKKELTVTPTAVALSYGDEKPTTFEYGIAGFALSDTKAVVRGEPTFACDYAKGSDVGTYDITVGVGGLSADNYTFAGVKGTLTVGQKTPTLSAVTATAITYGQTLADSVVSATVDPDVAGTFAWTDASLAPAVADGGVTVYAGTFTPTDTKNYRAAAFETTVVVNRKEIDVPTAVTGLVFNFDEQTGVASGEGYALTGEKATLPGDYEAKAALTDKDNTCWADDRTTDDKAIAWTIGRQTVEVDGVAEAGLDWNGSAVSFDISGLNLGSHTVADLMASFEVNGKTYNGQVMARGAGVYGVSFTVDAEGENAVVAAQAYEGTYRVTLGGEGGPVEVVSGTQTLLQGVPATETNGWFHETAAALGQTGAWTKGGETAELPVEAGRIVIEPTGKVPLAFAPQKTMDERTKGVVEMGLLYEGPCDEDDVAPEGGAQCAVRIAEDDETEAVKLQVYAALPDGESGWSVGWHDWNQAAAETYAFAVGTEYAIRLVCDYETGSNGLRCYVKAAGEEDYTLLFDGCLTGAADAASAPKRVASLALEGTGKVSVLDGDFTHDYIDASVAEVGGVRFLTVADAVAAANGRAITLLHRASWKPASAEEEKSAQFVNPELLELTSAEPEVIDANRIGVCSWSWHDDMTSILARMKKGGFKGMQLALSPWIWDAGEATAAQAETFGDVEGDEVLALIREKAAAGEIVIHATMIAFADEDYTSTTTISNTCGLFYGLAPSATDEQRANAESKWAHRSNQFERAAILTGEMGVPYLTAHLGLSGLDDAAKGYPRLAWACKVCRDNGCKLLIETGMYSAEETAALLGNLIQAHPELKGWVGLNFDTANQILYGTDTPTHAFPILRKWIDQVHIKDCVEDPALRGGWATDVEWGLGDVSRKYDIIAYLRENGFKGPLLVEHESGEATADARAKEIMTAVQALLTSNNADDPTCTTPDWIDPSLMEGDTPAEKTEAAMKAQGFDEEAAAAVAAAGEGAYETVAEWSQAWADGWQARGESCKPLPADLAQTPGVLTSAAIGADELLTEEDVKITELKPEDDGAVTVTVSLGEYENLKAGNEALLKAALGVTGAYGLGEGAFSAGNVDVTAKAVDVKAVELQAVPKKQDGVKPAQFFFRATAK